jgi:hypothetical protein
MWRNFGAKATALLILFVVSFIEERQNDHLWRSASNGSESHTMTFDEFNVRQLLCKDVIEAIERGTDKDKGVPTPSMGWLAPFVPVFLV